MPYSSDATIVLGDPTVSIDNMREDGFAQDIGTHIFSASGDIREILRFDYNNDDFEDAAILYDAGIVRLFENGDGQKFIDRVCDHRCSKRDQRHHDRRYGQKWTNGQ